MNTLLVSGYTAGYSDLARRLVASIQKHGGGPTAWVRPYSSSGSWVVNGHIKPDMLMAALLENSRRRPVAWVDADAEIVADPKGLDSITGCDVAVCRLSPKEVLSGTVWFAPTPGAMWVLAAWQDECRAHPEMWDQMALAKVLDGRRAPVKVGDLRPEFCFIPGTSEALKKGVPVIVHHQASREVRAGTRQM